jgi:hypothetical protein
VDENQILSKIADLLKEKNIVLIRVRRHSKASETYVDVEFVYPSEKSSWRGSVPIEYRRTGTFAKNAAEIAKLIAIAYERLNPKNYAAWIKEQALFWDAHDKAVTRAFFDAMLDFDWHCITCNLPKNPNWARRTQDIKEFGYTLATDTSRGCKKCGKNTTQLILLPLLRGSETGYETFSPKLRERILAVLDYYDAYEGKQTNSYALLPDHKFPEIRWDEKTRNENLEGMSDDEIRKKFQLLTNQRNQQKREVCRRCFQTGVRGSVFGINFFYEGDVNWPNGVPKTGEKAENGCIGCPWYDLQMWRSDLKSTIQK